MVCEEHLKQRKTKAEPEVKCGGRNNGRAGRQWEVS